MTVSTTTSKVSYAGDGATVAFPVTFPFFDADDLEVTERIIATGVETVKALGSDYTVSGGAGATGTVTATVAPASTVTWTIRRVTKRTQLIDYVSNDSLPAATHEAGLDRGALRDQELDEILARALRFPVSDGAGISAQIPDSVARASKFLTFDATGKPTASAVGTLGAVAVPVAVADGGTGSATASGARTNLGALAKAGDTLTGALEEVAYTDIASAATTAIGAVASNNLRITGTVTITSFGTIAGGVRRKIRFAAALTLTHNATSLILPGAANIVTAANDRAEAVSLGSGNWFVHDFIRADGTAVVSAPAATQAQQEAAAVTTAYVSPARQHFHPSAAKFWATISVAGGVPTLDASNNVAAIGDTAAGRVTITIANDFSSATWCCLVSTTPADITPDNDADTSNPNVESKAAGSVIVQASNNQSPPILDDPASWEVVGFGDQ